MLTVRRLLEMELFAEGRLVAGEGGLDRAIHWAHAMDIPRASEWVRAGELLLTTFYGLRDDAGAPAALCAELAAKGLAGMVVATGKYVDAVPEATRRAADDADFPVIELPWHIPFEDVVRLVSEHSLNDQYSLNTQSLAIHRSLTRLVLAGGLLQDVARELCKLLRRPVEIDDLAFNVLATATATETELDESRKSAIREGQSSPQLLDHLRRAGALARVRSTLAPERIDATPETRTLGMTKARILAPIVVARKIYGYVWIIAGERDLEPLDFHAIEHAATVAALILFRDQTAHQAEERAERGVLGRLLAADLQPDNALREQMARFRLRLEAPHVVVVIDPATNDLGMVELTARNAARCSGLACVFGERAGRVVALAETGRREQIDDFCRHVLAAEPRLDTPLRLGISPVREDLTGLHRAYECALEALALLPVLGEKGRIAHFEELGLIHWLHELPPQLLAENAYVHRLQRLVDHDRAHNAQLVHTLDVFLEYDGNGVRTAREMFIHRHTLKYRLHRIQEISGLDVADPLCKFNLRAALLLHRMRARYDAP